MVVWKAPARRGWRNDAWPSASAPGSPRSPSPPAGIFRWVCLSCREPIVLSRRHDHALHIPGPPASRTEPKRVHLLGVGRRWPTARGRGIIIIVWSHSWALCARDVKAETHTHMRPEVLRNTLEQARHSAYILPADPSAAQGARRGTLLREKRPAQVLLGATTDSQPSAQ